MPIQWLNPWRKTNPLSGVCSYVLYYGHPTEQVLEGLSAFDMAVIEPHSYSAGQIAQIKAGGTRTIGYISIMESPAWNVWRTPHLLDSDYLLHDGERHHFPLWDSYLMDLTSVNYRRVLLDEITGQIAAKGFDGVLLDTVGDIDDFVAGEAAKSAQLQAYSHLLAELERLFPDMLFVQNRGFAAAGQVSRHLDGFLWEDWDGSWRSNGWMILRVKQARRWQRRGIRIFTLSRSDHELHAAAALKLGFVHHARPQGYNAW